MEEVLDWTERQSGPWAACLNIMDAHWPYDPFPEYDKWGSPDVHALRDDVAEALWQFEGGQRAFEDWEALEALYDGAIYQVDQQIAFLVDRLRERGEFEDTMLIVTSDHGEGFGEQSRIRPDVRVREHGASALHEAVAHVPLLVKEPGHMDAKTDDTVETLTNLPTMIADSLGLNARPDRFTNRRSPLYTAMGIDEDESKYDTATAYCDEMWKYTGVGHALYEQAGERIHKQMHWTAGRDTYDCSITITVNGDPTVNDDLTENPVVEFVTCLDDCGVKASGRSDDETIDIETERRLSELGYL
jgi:arylsulfatase